MPERLEEATGRSEEPAVAAVAVAVPEVAWFAVQRVRTSLGRSWQEGDSVLERCPAEKWARIEELTWTGFSAQSLPVVELVC